MRFIRRFHERALLSLRWFCIYAKVQNAMNTFQLFVFLAGRQRFVCQQHPACHFPPLCSLFILAINDEFISWT
jgi:hypothetical protein